MCGLTKCRAGVLRPKGLGVVQGGFDYAMTKAEVESIKDKGGYGLKEKVIN